MLKIETMRKKGEVFFSDGSRFSGDFFVSPSSAGHAGSELVYDLLNSERSFIPFELQEGEVVLFQKDSIVKVLLEENELAKDQPYHKENRARVHLLSGETIEGKVYLDLPETHFRLSDFLNYSHAFFYLEVNGQDYLINSRFIKLVRNS